MIARAHISTGFILFVLILAGCPDQQSNQKDLEIEAKETEVSGRVDRLLARLKDRPPEAELQKALSKLNLEKTVDDVLGITWYTQTYFKHFNSDSGISIYLGDNGTIHWLYLKMSYWGYDWIFFRNAYLSYDGNTKEVLFDQFEHKKTDTGYLRYDPDNLRVWEWIQVKVTEDVELFLREFAKSPNAKMRLSGKYAETRLLTDSERKGILDVLNAFDVFNGSSTTDNP